MPEEDVMSKNYNRIAYVDELITKELRTFEAVWGFMKEMGIAGSPRRTEKGMRLIMEVDGTPYDGVSSYVTLFFSEDSALKTVKAPSGLLLSADAVSSVKDVGGVGLFLITFSKEGSDVGNVMALSRMMLRNLCLISDASELTAFLMNDDVMPGIEISDDGLLMTLPLFEGGRLELSYDRMGDGYVISSLKCGGVEEKAYWIDIAESKADAAARGLAVAVADSCGGKTLRRFRVARIGQEM